MSQALFKENYHGVLSHDGWVRVAKFKITGKILNISNKGLVQVSAKSKKSYVCDVHKNLKKDVKFMNVGDIVGVKWNCGRPYIVGYKKSTAKDVEYKPTGDEAISENTNWIMFFKDMGL